MIELATESTAGRMSYRLPASDAKGSDREVQHGRSGHAWPFLSRYAARPAQQEGRKSSANNGGS
jgi:hypothetical protein